MTNSATNITLRLTHFELSFYDKFQPFDGEFWKHLTTS